MYYKFYTTRFQKSLKKVLRSGRIKRQDVETVTDILASGDLLPAKFQDHPLHGDYEGFRECHIKFDLLLVYKIKDQKLILILFDIGTHSELF